MPRNINQAKLAGIVLLLVLSLIVSSPSLAMSKDIQIMVSGPWSYLTDPADSGRLIVIAPDEPHHYLPIAFSGGDVTTPALNPVPFQKGIYSLDIANISSCNTHANSVSLFPLTVDVETVIKPLLKGPATFYAISVPKPCYYTDEMGMRERSIIDPDNPITAVRPDAAYTTWMIFHYTVSNVAPAVITDSNGKKSNVDFGSDSAISVVMYGPEFDPYPNNCDSISATSVKASGKLFNKNLRVWQPEVDEFGAQGDYIPGCQDNSVDENKIAEINRVKEILKLVTQVEKYAYRPKPKRAEHALRVLDEINIKIQRLDAPESVRNEVKTAKARLLSLQQQSEASQKRAGPNSNQVVNTSPLLPLTAQFALYRSAGSADCKGAQLNIDNSIP
jgi:hypothetical protein